MHILDIFTHCPFCGSAHFLTQDEKSKRCADCGHEYYLNPSSANAAFVVNGKGEMLAIRRKKEPQAGMLDLPGGFADIGETAEEGVAREVKEETGLTVKKVEYLFSFPNNYLYSGMNIPTLDLFFLCRVDDFSTLHAADDADATLWLLPDEVEPEAFAFESIRNGVRAFLKKLKKSPI